ncbi:hypothetical protein PPTG_22131 [Phytophthora nicotianae INRA-310]|uniref:Uncharacterized protein n=1 Tax=Phytophthora nicotianae (strain INRA-310) TaxID=761204 RepID=W2QPS6_PHYN3|nr:hypothetical protein PPTG_22131 [Phytophthora nicotianae INRA-310]ETN14509.1 hypothetical protein PPTG_22131 [Phytophthora nicotianae INRA-310]
MFHARGMLFVGASEPTSYVLPLVPHVTTSDLPGQKTYTQEKAILDWEGLEEKAEAQLEPRLKHVRGRPSVAKYINDIIAEATKRIAKRLHYCRRPSFQDYQVTHSDEVPQRTRTPRLNWRSNGFHTRCVAAGFAHEIGFAYVSTTTREDQSVAKILAGYRDPHLPCSTPTILTLPENVCGFPDVSLNVDSNVLDAALASLLIHLEDVAAVITKEQAATGYTSHYLYRLLEAFDTTNAALGYGLSLETCFGWLRTSWETENFAQRWRHDRSCCRCNAAVVLGVNNAAGAAEARQDSRTVIVGFSRQYLLWNTATQKKQQFVRADLKACINIMIIVAGRDVDVPAAPLDPDGVANQLWKQELWTLSADLDTKTNAALCKLDDKGNSKTPGSLRNRWRKQRTDHRGVYDALCSAFITRKAGGVVVDCCTPDSHQWKQKDLES